MHNHTHVVIGANYGDEGKGLVTDYLCQLMLSEIPEILGSSEFRILNIRHNGGAQAGHSVYHDGKKHVFGHFGAGMFRSTVDTWLTRDYIVNPYLFMKEMASFCASSDRIPNIYVSNDCIITTPFDVMRNQIIAKLAACATVPHKETVGVGIFETVKRNRDPKFRLVVGDFRDHAYREHALTVLNRIADDIYTWYEDLVSVEVKNGFVPPFVWNEYFSRMNASIVIENFMATMKYFLQNTFDDVTLRGKYPNVVMEGAQGLALSQANMYAKNGILPPALFALTPSFTGMENISSLTANDFTTRAGKDVLLNTDVHLHYVTRSYFTRHGRGPFPTQLNNSDIPLEWTIRDSTNRYHEYQGDLRIGHFRSHELFTRIQEDLTKISSNKVSSITLHVNFLDQTGDKLYDIVNESQFKMFQLCRGGDLRMGAHGTEVQFKDVCAGIPKSEVTDYLIVKARQYRITLNNVVFHDTSEFEPHAYLGR